MNHFYKKMGQQTAWIWGADWLKKTLFLCLVLATFVASAQSVTVSGKITDSSDGSGLPGVTIQEKGTSNGTTTDFDGKFQITVSSSQAVLVISSVGFTTQEIAVGNQSSINISLVEDVTALGEIVVIGYGTVKKTDLTGSVTAITSEDFNKGANTSPQDLLVGRMPGVSVITDGGAPGTGSTIRIRGGSSLSASNNPLFVIDGVVIADEGIAGVRNPLSLINPNDIANVTVLKDASATAIYGARASNGVVIVNTKRGTSGQPMTVGYSANFSVSTLPKQVEVLNTDQYRYLMDQAVDNGQVPGTALGLLGENETNWQDQIYRQAFAMDHNVSVSGSMKNTPSFMEALPYRASVGYTNQDGILKNTNFERMSASLALDPSFLGGDLTLQINAKYTTTNNTFTNEGAIGSAVTYDPTQPIRDSDSPWGGYSYWEQQGAPGFPITIAPNNPVALLNLTDDGSTVNRFLGNVKATYKIPFVEGLSATINAAMDRSMSEGATTIDEGATWEWEDASTDFFGRKSSYGAENKNDLIEYYMNYSKEISSINSRIEVLGGYSWQEFYRASSFKSFDITETFVKTPEDTASSQNRLISFFGRLNYTLNEKYLLTFTLRRDGSSRFAEDNQWGLFPSAAIAWKVKDENFLQSVDVISDLKFRAGYGVTGQENIGPSYPALARVTTGNEFSQYPIDGVVYRVARFEGYDANLKWEETTTYNVGMDFGVWDNRITGTVDYFQRNTIDLLNEINIPIGTNLTNRIITNVGSMEIKGIEVALNAILLDNTDWRVDVGANFTHLSNEITKLTVVDDPDYQGVEVGGISGGVGSNIQIHSVGYPRSSFYALQQVYNENGRPIEGLYLDQNGDGIINDSDRVRYESPDANVMMGFNSNVSYKNMYFGFNARMNLGNYNYNNVASNNGFYDNSYNSAGWTSNMHFDVRNTNFKSPQYFSDYYVQNASFFRMDNIFVGYRFNELFSERVSGAVNFTVQNAFVITKYEGLDPEVSNGIDNNLYPRPRVFSLGLNINFK